MIRLKAQDYFKEALDMDRNVISSWVVAFRSNSVAVEELSVALRRSRQTLERAEAALIRELEAADIDFFEDESGMTTLVEGADGKRFIVSV